MNLLRIVSAILWISISFQFIHKDIANVKLVMEHQKKHKETYLMTRLLVWAYIFINALLPSSIAGFLPKPLEFTLIFSWVICCVWHYIFTTNNSQLIDKLSEERGLFQ